MSTQGTPNEELAAIARGKLARVLGEAQGHRVFDETLAHMGIDGFRTADQLYAFGERLVLRGGIEAAVGRLVCVAAVVRGAAGSPREGQPGG